VESSGHRTDESTSHLALIKHLAPRARCLNLECRHNNNNNKGKSLDTRAQSPAVQGPPPAPAGRGSPLLVAPCSCSLLQAARLLLLLRLRQKWQGTRKWHAARSTQHAVVASSGSGKWQVGHHTAHCQHCASTHSNKHKWVALGLGAGSRKQEASSKQQAAIGPHSCFTSGSVLKI
jgi:hypothetical protein